MTTLPTKHQRLSEVERLRARKKLTESEKLLSTQIYEKLGDDRSFGIIRSKGDLHQTPTTFRLLPLKTEH